MNRRHAVGMLGLAGLASLKAAPARDRFPGIYKLVSWRTTNEDGSIVEPMGHDPIGRITYHKAGYMSAILMRRDRKAPPRIDLKTALIDELREAVRQMQTNGGAFVTYMGTFDVDEKASTVTHHLQGGSSPTFIGIDFLRRYAFTEKGINLSTPPNFNSTLVWERVADA
jgi:hypothetical protein